MCEELYGTFGGICFTTCSAARWTCSVMERRTFASSLWRSAEGRTCGLCARRQRALRGRFALLPRIPFTFDCSFRARVWQILC